VCFPNFHSCTKYTIFVFNTEGGAASSTVGGTSVLGEPDLACLDIKAVSSTMTIY
jgi:hypothetical protein